VVEDKRPLEKEILPKDIFVNENLSMMFMLSPFSGLCIDAEVGNVSEVSEVHYDSFIRVELSWLSWNLCMYGVLVHQTWRVEAHGRTGLIGTIDREMYVRSVGNITHVHTVQTPKNRMNIY
jgi:hypothetical protein